jgi:hypothetical protein
MKFGLLINGEFSGGLDVLQTFGLDLLSLMAMEKKP